MPPKEKLRPHPVTMSVGEALRVPKVRFPRVPREVIERINGDLAQAIRNLAGQGTARPWVVVTEPAGICAAAY